MIEYEVKDLLLVLLKKWYLILLITAVFCLASIPMAKQSYRRALNNYNEWVVRPDEAKRDHEAAEISVCVLEVLGRNEGSLALSDAEAAVLVYRLLTNDPVRKVLNGRNENLQIQVDLITNSNSILISSTQPSEGEFERLISEIQNMFKTDLYSVIEGQLKIEFGDIMVQEISSSQDFEVSFAEEVMREPSKPDNYSRIMMSAAVLGFLVGVTAILIREYISANKQAEEVSG